MTLCGFPKLLFIRILYDNTSTHDRHAATLSLPSHCLGPHLSLTRLNPHRGWINTFGLVSSWCSAL
ncbi:hypothetical protein ACTXT7_000265 [Hymenolepis weldensis]